MSGTDRDRRAYEWLFVIPWFLVIGLPILYVAAYLSLVDQMRIAFFTEGMPNVTVAHYPQPWMKSFFAPLEQLDRKVRPGYWRP